MAFCEFAHVASERAPPPCARVPGELAHSNFFQAMLLSLPHKRTGFIPDTTGVRAVALGKMYREEVS